MSAARALSHCASAECAVPAAVAYRFLLDGAALGRWALGSYRTRRVGVNLWRGTSLFDGRAVLVRPVGDAKRFVVDYYVGPDRASLAPRIMARAVPGASLGLPRGRSIVTLLAWRDAAMTDECWDRLVACHEVEIRLIRAHLARGRR